MGFVFLIIVLIVVLVVALGWLVEVGRLRRTPSEVLDETQNADQLLGPGGPDDPRARPAPW
jgi:hypothetical protein